MSRLQLEDANGGGFLLLEAGNSGGYLLLEQEIPGPGASLATLQTRLTERYDGQVFWTPDQARRAINEALRIWNLITGAFRTPYPQGLVTIPNDPYLFVGGTIEKVTRVRFLLPTGRELNPISIFQLDQLFPGWEGLTTASPGQPTAPRYWAPVGLNEIAIFPADAAGPRAIYIEGIVAATPLVNPTDTLPLGDEEINTLLGYALHVLSFSKGLVALQNTKPLYLAFLKAAAKRNAVFAASSLYRKLIGRDMQRDAQPLRDQPTSDNADAVIAQSEGEE